MMMIPLAGNGGVEGEVAQLEFKSARIGTEKKSKCLLRFLDPVTMTMAGAGFEARGRCMRAAVPL